MFSLDYVYLVNLSNTCQYYITLLYKSFTVFSTPILTDDNTTSTDRSTPAAEGSAKPTNHASPEMVPNYGKLLKKIIDIKNGPGFWNKENGENIKDKVLNI